MGIRSTMEIAFEDAVIKHLENSGWIHEPGTVGWDKSRALHIPDVLHWLSTQHAEEFEKAVPNHFNDTQRTVVVGKLLDRLTSMLDKTPTLNQETRQINHGLLGTLRNGFSHTQRGHQKATFKDMVAFHPENPLYTTVTERVQHNRLRVIRQVPFDKNSTDTIDLVLLVNGIPVVTIELKTDNTQSVGDAVRQYKRDRQPSKNRPLLKPGRALVHFAVSNQEVEMTTELAGNDTFFLPFNKGYDGHAGNPPNPNGSDTSYLWEEVLQPDLFLRIIRDYALWEPAKKGNAGRLIFPRYHQLRATEKVITDITEKGAGGRYLIQHSAGSGKTKTIAWMAHRAGRLMDKNGEQIFDSVVIVTDRTALDDNVNEGLQLVRSSKNLVVNVDQELGSKSKKLEKALNEGGHIISTTIQTFPALAKMLEKSPNLQGRNYCVIIDEAHSSQHGEAAKTLRETLVTVDLPDDEELTADDMLLAVDEAVANSSNLSFIALTATPKAKTLAAYGVPDPENPERLTAYDTYMMSQAIEEEFILDVLSNYSTYSMFARIRDELGREEEVDLGAAVSDMVRFARLHPTSIAQRVEIVVEHFRRNVMHHLNGSAKAMVVSADRKSALNWYLKMNEYIADKEYDDMTTLVAFSGNLSMEGMEQADVYGVMVTERSLNEVTVTERSLNQVKDTALHFRENNDSKMMIVANKFQTGFDEPRLCAMYVDKKLSGVQAVQTLSRLNRTYPKKPKPMVVDFANNPQDILDSFIPYYREASIQDDVPANALADLGDLLDAAAFYTMKELDTLADAHIRRADSEELQGLISPIRARWNQHMRSARMRGEDGKEAYELGYAFRTNLIKYAHAWEFLSQIVDYQDAVIHKRAIVAGLLAKNLKLGRLDDDEDFTTGIELAGVAVKPAQLEQDLELEKSEEDTDLVLPGFDGQPVGQESPVIAAFNEAVEQVNQILAAAGLDPNDTATANAIRASYGILVEDEMVQTLARENDVNQVLRSNLFQTRGSGAIVTAARKSQEIYDTITVDRDNLDAVLLTLAHLIVAAKEDDEDKHRGTILSRLGL